MSGLEKLIENSIVTEVSEEQLGKSRVRIHQAMDKLARQGQRGIDDSNHIIIGPGM